MGFHSLWVTSFLFNYPMAIQDFLKNKSKIKLDFKNRPQQAAAFLISRILGPAPLLCLLWFVTATKSGIGFGKALWAYPIIFIISLGAPIIISSWLIKIGKIRNIEWSDIEDRKKYFLPLALSSSISLILLTKLLTNETTFHLSILLSTIVLIMAASYKYFNFKISGHMIIAVVTFSGINLYFHQQFLWLFLLIIPIIWARYTLKVHKMTELLAGLIMPLVVSAIAVLLFGWPSVPK